MGLQRGVHHSGHKETGTWRCRHQFLSADFEPAGIVKAPGTSHCPSADGVPVFRWPYTVVTIWIPPGTRLKPLFCGCCQTYYRLSTVVIQPPWMPDPSGFISGLWHGRPCDLSTAAADNFWHWWQCSSMVSVLPVRPASVCTPLVCAINNRLPHVSQGSVLGPVLFVLYTVELISLIERVSP